MDDALFPESETMDVLIGYCGDYVAWGIGLALIAWLLGYVIWFVIDALRY